MNTTAASENEVNLNKDAAGIILVGLAVILFLALFSYSPQDSAINTVSGESPHNTISLVGAYIADALVSGFGLFSYALPVGLTILALLFFLGVPLSYRLSRIVGGFLILTAGCSIFSILSMPRTPHELLIRSGGLVGWVIAVKLYPLFGKAGGLTILAASALVGAVWTFNFTFYGAAKRIVRGFGGVLTAARANAGEWSERRRIRKEQAMDEAEEDGPHIHAPEPKFAKTPNIVKVKVDYAPPPSPEKAPAAEKVVVREPVPFDDDEPPVIEPVSKPEKTAAPKIRERADTNPVPSAQIEFPTFTGAYQPPSIDLLEDYRGLNVPVDRQVLLASCQVLEKKLDDFGVKGRVSDVHPGPVITTFEFEPAPGIKVNRVANLEDDLAMALRAESIRIVAPIPGKGAVGIEVPNRKRETIYLREVVESQAFQMAESALSVAFGKNVVGQPVVQDLARMPHLLVAGTTGSGKSVFINSVITSILFKASPDEVRLILIDPKMLELSDYADIPHLLCPVCTQPKKAANILRWAVSEMETRYAKMRDLGVRNITSFNKKVERILHQNHGSRRPVTSPDGEPLKKFPFILVIIDELADLMMVAPKDLEESIARLAQMARAAGIHLILATQRPSVDVITGVIKNNLPARVSFRVSSKVDSRTILDTHGAQTLLGNGDMLFLPPTSSKIDRIHGCWISEGEVQKVVEHIKKFGRANYDESVMNAPDEEGGEAGDDIYDENEIDPAFDKAVEIVARERKASVSYVQRRLKIGYNRAARIIERMEREGMIGPSDGTSRPRDIMMPGARGDDGEEE